MKTAILTFCYTAFMIRRNSRPTFRLIQGFTPGHNATLKGRYPTDTPSVSVNILDQKNVSLNTIQIPSEYS